MFAHLKKHHPLSYKRARPDVSQSSSRSRPDVKQQPTITGLFTSLTKYKKNDHKHISLTKAVAVFLCETMTPIHVVEQPSWKRLLAKLDSRYECPSRAYFTYTAIPALYNEIRETLQAELKDAGKFALTMDAWSSITTSPFLVITVHFINRSMQLVSRCLQCVYVPEDHTAINIAARVEEVLQDFGLEKKNVVSITTDSGSNMVAALRKLDVVRLTCFGHVLHNAIGAATKDARVKRTVGVCRKIVSAFSFSFKKSRAFLQTQERLDIDKKTLKSDVATRWGSMYKMVQSIHHNHPAIQSLFSQGG